MTAFLFAATVLIWGTTWIGIALQLGPVSVQVAIFWRFALAALILMAWLAATGRLRVPAARHHPFLIGQGACIFSINFVGLYLAETHITSGLVSVVFSLATLFNAVNARLFFGDRIAGRMLLAAPVGVAGLVLLFWPDISFDGGAGTLAGLLFAALGTFCFSLGNMLSRRNAAAGLPLSLVNGWGMTYGAIILAAIALVRGDDFALPSDPVWLGATAYLAVVGSVFGFAAYLGLVQRIGPARAAYATVLFPVVALTISTFVEGYVWHWQSVAGLALVIAANLIVFAPVPRRRVQNGTTAPS